MSRSRKFKPSKLDTKLMVDVVGASLIVQQVPALLENWFKLDTTISKIGAVGVGYVVGSMFNRPNIANASIALFVTDLVMPMIGGILPGGSSSPVSMIPGASMPPAKLPIVKTLTPKVALDDYFTLNDYVSSPGTSAPFAAYKDSY